MTRYNEHQRELAYRIYVTDSLKFIARTQERYADWISPRKQDSRTGEEIAADIITRAGLVVSE